jgi:hypothetical protein
MGVCYITISFANNQTIEKLYEEKMRGNGKKRYDTDSYYDEEENNDDDVFPLDLNDYEERLGKGFKIFDMATRGYPSDG